METGGYLLSTSNGGGNDDAAVKAPFLEATTEAQRSSRKFSLKNSVSSLWSDFIAKLPEKIRSCVDIESSSILDLSKADITQGEKDYYERQIATLKSFEEVDNVATTDVIDEENFEEQAQQERAMRISNYSNVVLLLLKDFEYSSSWPW